MDAYRERLRVPLRWWVQGSMIVISVWLAFIIAVPPALAWSITALAAALVAGGLVAYGLLPVQVEAGMLRAGRARIALHHLGAVEALDAEQTRRVAGPEADARAFLALRPYLKRAVRVGIDDPADPTPYWLISTRHPDRLAAALTRVANDTASP